MLLNVLLILFGLPLVVAPLAVVGLRELARVKARAERRRQVLVMTVVEPVRREAAAIESGQRPMKELTR